MDRAGITGRFVAKASKVQVGTKARRGHFSTSFPFDSLCTELRIKCIGVHVNGCFLDENLYICVLIRASDLLLEHLRTG